MHKVALFNGSIVDINDAVIPALSAAAMYGRGVFTTIAVYDGEPFLLEKHWRRLTNNAERIGIDVGFELADLTGWLDFLIRENHAVDCRARVTILDTGGAGTWAGGSEKRTDVLMICGDIVERPGTFRLTTSRYAINATSPLAGIKSCNYLDHLMAYEDARWRGCDEAIRINERGEVTSAAMANVFWLSNEQLFTPSLVTGCLAGTTREFILENLPVRELRAGLGDLLAAEAVFISSAGVGIRSVASIDQTPFRSIEHPILNLLPPNAKTRMSAR